MATGERGRRTRKPARRAEQPPVSAPERLTEAEREADEHAAVAAAAVAAADRRRRKFRLTEAGVAFAALLLSGAAFVGSIAVYLRGSEIVTLQPKEFVMYRDAGPSGADLYVAVPVAMINAARSDYGDVVTRATVRFKGPKASDVSFFYEAVIEPVMSRDVTRAVENCPDGARCIAETGFYVIERPARLLDVPGGSSRTDYLSFGIYPPGCAGPPAQCEQFRSFDGAVEAMRRSGPITILVELETFFDGKHSLECRLPAAPEERDAIYDYLRSRGWAMPGCEDARQGGTA